MGEAGDAGAFSEEEGDGGGVTTVGGEPEEHIRVDDADRMKLGYVDDWGSGSRGGDDRAAKTTTSEAASSCSVRDSAEAESAGC